MQKSNKKETNKKTKSRSSVRVTTKSKNTKPIKIYDNNIEYIDIDDIDKIDDGNKQYDQHTIRKNHEDVKNDKTKKTTIKRNKKIPIRWKPIEGFESYLISN